MHCPPEKVPIFPIASPSYQEVNTSLSAPSIRGQTEEARRSLTGTKTKTILQKVNQYEKEESYVPDERKR